MKSKYNLLLLSILLSLLYSCDAGYNGNESTTGHAGSLARFIVVDDYLYVATNQDLKIFDVTTDDAPVLSNTTYVGNEIETIFCRDTLLFFGSMYGMEILSIADPANPFYVSSFYHISSCDPVVVDSNYAYITLHVSEGDDWCGRDINELQIVDVSDVFNPILIAQYDMTCPLGLGIDNDTLYICDDGLKVYDVSNRLNIKLLQHFQIQANDIIVLENHLIVVGDDGLYQYKIENNEISLLSKLEICNNNNLP